MNSTTLHSSPVKDGRRILGEKTVNACMSPHRHVSPVKHSFLDVSSPKKQLLPSPSFAGQKRSIDQVDHGVSGNKDPRRVRDEAVTVQATSRPSSLSPFSSREQTTTSDLQAPATESRDSNQDPQPQTHEQPKATPEPESTKTPQEESRSTTRLVPEDPETRKLFIQQKASLLRNRIQSAMRHVRDPQFDRRLSELEAHSRKLPRLSVPEASTPSPHAKDPASASSPAFTPRALPPSQELNQPSETTAPAPSGLSSPPLSQGNAHAQDDPMKTPTQKTHRRTDTAGSPMQLSSPPASASRGGRSVRTPTGAETIQQEDAAREQRLVTPAQRGDAVDGLLKLMSTGEKRTDSSPWAGSE
ncbi:hypothetical protein P170DRAFT_117593 [Aspergillus steynii IBT 23096]|uniref:Uncharacterized protein n=1 Tax=Aspergillus steynii IBT 23096 TaxID=1392250 RepID=A0A2I2GJ80_9EURO|nr:uncharacterized protein P170DRAFT_117593 [Aspergillus steynii IBT 23096]PLB52928.1 hypothetical protein P170DRAFT_117593 [Aspergillus steynii IBT 23096]